jgi:gp178
MNLQGLIERYEKFKDSKKKLTSVDLVLKDLRSLDEPEPLPFKLKDVVRRIRGFDPTTQIRWLNDILKELGDDYGSMKYRSGYEQGKLEGEWVGNQLKDADKIRQELNKPVVPQFVADWYEENKDVFEGNLYRFVYNLTSIFDGAKFNEFERWFLTAGTKPFQTLINMHQFGYEVEKEKRYRVKVKGICGNHETLNREKHSNKWLFSDREENSLYGTHHTRKELEEAGFGEVFNSPLFEVEEVEE